MNNQNQKIVYGMYARKSSEAEDKQALSIESQITENKKVADQYEIKISEDCIFSESKSAKKSFQRPVFEKLIKDIEKGTIQGVVAWHANRLSRNAIDAARLVDLMDQEKLLEIVTQQQVFKNTPQDKFMLTLFCSQAKLENDNKGVDVKRGLRKKCEIGYPPRMAKIGYQNDYGKKGERKIIKDEERFDLVKQVLERYLTGKYSVRELHRFSDKKLGLRTIQRKKEGGKPIQLSQFYKTLQDPFYAGFFYGKDGDGNKVRYEVNKSVPRMITEAQYWRAQEMLGRKGQPRPSVNKEIFPYLGIPKCGGCGGSVTAELKQQLICSNCKYKFSYLNRKVCPGCGFLIEKMENPKYLRYVYYHCVKKSNPMCIERSIREDNMDTYFSDYVREYLEISPALSEWCIENIKELEKKDNFDQGSIYKNWERELIKKEKEASELVGMRARGLIEDDDFTARQIPLKAEVASIREKLSGRVKRTAGDISKPFSFVSGLSDVFEGDDYNAKRGALNEMVSNLTIKNKKPSICLTKELSIIARGLSLAKAKNARFEPRKCLANKDETEVFASVRPTLLRR